MKEGWEYKKLGEVATIINGKNQKAVENVNGIYPICGSGGIMGYANDFLCPEQTVILGRKGNINRPIFMEQKFWNVDTAFGIVAKKSQLYSKFLYYFCIDFNFEKLNKAVTIPSLVKSDLLKIDMPVPPVSEQQHIVEELDLLSSIIEKKKAQLNELDNLAQSLFYEMFGDPITNEKGWEVRKLADISKEKLSYGSGASAIPYDGKMRYIRITDINDSGELNDNIVSPNSFNEKYLLNDGDILFARSGATVGKTYYHKVKNGKCIYAGYLIRLIPNADIVLPSYVFGYTKTQYYMEFVKSAQNAVAQPNINAKQYGNLDICIPPLSLQQQFTSKLEAIEHQKELIKKSIKEVETLFNSRMDYYFN